MKYVLVILFLCSSSVVYAQTLKYRGNLLFQEGSSTEQIPRKQVTDVWMRPYKKTIQFKVNGSPWFNVGIIGSVNMSAISPIYRFRYSRTVTCIARQTIALPKKIAKSMRACIRGEVACTDGYDVDLTYCGTIKR